ncbi:hypothetical protein Tco_0917206 [Tanacetum coccineum]
MVRLWWLCRRHSGDVNRLSAARHPEGLRCHSPTPHGAAVVAVPSSDRHHDGGVFRRLWWLIRHPQPATTAVATGKRWHDGCYGGFMVTRREGLKVAAGGVIWWPESPWRRQIFWRERGG